MAHFLDLIPSSFLCCCVNIWKKSNWKSRTCSHSSLELWRMTIHKCTRAMKRECVFLYENCFCTDFAFHSLGWVSFIFAAAAAVGSPAACLPAAASSRCNNSSSSSICSAFSVRDSSRSHLARRHFQSSRCLKVHTKHGTHVISKLAFLSLCGLSTLYLWEIFYDLHIY